ncbi:MAG: TIGR00266 family protein [bacterium]|jgi:uncharacterized protein (TIGR00266 family)
MGDLVYEIKGTVHQAVQISLEEGRRVFSETGGMLWMDTNIEMDTSMPGGGKGGLLGAIGGALTRAVAGESVFLNYFTAKGGPGRVTFASSFLGTVIPKKLEAGKSIFAQRGAFLCAEDTCQLKVEFTKKLGAGLFGGEGFILQRITGPGTCFLEIDGESTHLDLEAGQTIKLDAGHLAAFEETVSYNIEFQKNIKNLLLSGEGFAFAVLTGPGRVWLQHQTMSGLAALLKPFFPDKAN